MFEKLKDLPIAAIAGFFIVYSSISGCLWHLGYWSTLKFNFLEFASLTDLFKASIYPFFAKIWIFMMVVLAPLSMLGFTAMLDYSSLKNNGKRFFSPIKFKLPVASVFIGISGVITFYFSGALFSNSSQWNVLPYSIALLLASVVFLTKILQDKIKDDFSRLLIFFFIFLYPSLNYSIAKKKSIEVLHMFRYQQVVDIVCSDTVLRRNLINTAYVGNTDKYYFFFNPISVTVVQTDKIEAMILREKIDMKNYEAWHKY